MLMRKLQGQESLASLRTCLRSSNAMTIVWYFEKVLGFAILIK